MKPRLLAIGALLPALLLAGCGGSSDNGTSSADLSEQLMVPGALPDEWLGNNDAPVTVIEYASMTCPHCRVFEETVFGDFKTEFVDTGIVRYVLREFPLDERAAAAIMLARCAPGDNGFYTVVEHLFETQTEWAGVDPSVFLDTLFGQVQQAGFTRDTFDACLANQELLDNVTAVQNYAVGLGVDSTPTFFINGKKYVGEISLDDLRAAIADAQAG